MPRLVGVDDLSAQISEWRDNEVAAAEAAARSRRHWLAQQAEESTTVVAVLLTLAERRALVTLRTAGGPQRGAITSVTTALCTVDLGSGRALVPVAAITAIETGGRDISDDRVPSATTSLAAVLASLVAERPPVTLHLADGTTVGGRLVRVGADVVGVSGLTVTHVPLAAIAACVL